jgi:hypothetical protein
MIINNETITKALLNLVPNAEWTLSGDDYSKLNWLSDGVAPTYADIEKMILSLPAKEDKAKIDAEKAKTNLLNKLGITAEEAAILLG